MFCSPLVAAGQTSSTKRSTVKKALTPAEQIATLTQEVQEYQALLQKPDVASDAYRRNKVKEQWIIATCNLEVLSLPASVVHDPKFVDGLKAACSERLNSQPVEAGITPPAKGAVVPPKAAANDQCSVDPDPPIASGLNTKYGYTIQCPKGVTPNAIAINTAQAQPAITDAQGRAFAQGVAAALGITPPSYDSANSTVSFTFPVGAGPQGFELLVPTASTQITTATYLIAFGAVADATSCQPGPGCSIGAIRIPVPKATTCPNDYNSALSADVPTLDATDVGSDTLTGKVPKATSGTVQLCSGGVLIGSPVSVDKTGAFTVAGLKQLAATQSMKGGVQIQAQYTNAVNISGPPSPVLSVGSCKQAGSSGKGTAPKTTLTESTDSTGKVTYSGKVTGATPGTTTKVRLCVDDLESSNTTAVADDGSFNAGTLDVKPGQIVAAQDFTPGTPRSYGPISNGLAFGKCSTLGKGEASSRPTLNPVEIGSETVSGSVPNTKGGLVRVCVGDIQVATAPIAADGTFTGSLPTPVVSGQSVTAQVMSDQDAPPVTYGLASSEQKADSDGFVGTFIAGVEQSGYSSLGNNTGAFLNAFFRSGYLQTSRNTGLAFWGRVRLLSAPQPSTSGGIVSIVSNPTGTLTAANYNSIGTAVDYVIGPEFKLKQWNYAGSTSRVSLVAGAGATTPLSSNDIAVTYAAPDPNTTECAQLVNNFGPKSGYVPHLVANPNQGAMGSCIYNPASGVPYKFISFSNENRSNFLFKWGAGARFTHAYPAKGTSPGYSGSIDLTLGQDSTVTGGNAHGWVLKLDGVYPLTFGGSSLLYVFGSAAMRLAHDQEFPPLILAPGTGAPTPPSTQVIVLPLKQPNRDFYRLGFGLNLAAIWCKFATTGCPDTSAQTTKTAGTTTTTTNSGSGTPTGK
jgi:hypothetical protein